jgi:diacylglycerol kinase family enzyme
MASLFTAAVAKTPTQRDDILFMRTKSIKVTASPAQPLVIDGEIVDANPIVFECIPKGLTVFAPLPTI